MPNQCAEGTNPASDQVIQALRNQEKRGTHDKWVSWSQVNSHRQTKSTQSD